MSADRSVMGVVLDSLESFSIRCHACIFEWAAISAQFVLIASVSNVLLPIAAFVLVICCCWLLVAVLITILDPGQKFREIPLTVFGIPLIHAIWYGAPKKQRDSPAKRFKIPPKQFPLKEIRLYFPSNKYHNISYYISNMAQ